jgi:molecular chaperone GrpE
VSGGPFEQERDPDRPEGVRVTDKRRVDLTGKTRVPDQPPVAVVAEPSLGQAGQPGESDEVAQANARAAEAVADAKRIAAEYANYRRRVDRDRELQRDVAIGSVIVDLLPILDDVGRARAHGELTGGFRSVGEAVEAMAAKSGLESFGEVGEPFDPNVHHAMTSEHSDEVEGPTVTAVYQVGYRLRGRVLRPASVAVADSQ